MPSTLLTGANSFFAAHLINQLLADGHTVTGTVRSLSKGEQLLELHPEWKDSLQFVEVRDLHKPGAWNDVLEHRNFDYVVHNAAPMPDSQSATDFDRDFLQPSVGGDLELLKAVHAYGPNVKHITFVGSVNAITDGSADSIANRVLTNKDWIPYTVDDARAMKSAFISYCVAKKEAERAIWHYVESEKPRFTVTVFCPTLIIGPAIHHVNNLQKINLTNDFMYSYFNGTNKGIPPTPFPAYIDARDAALAHVRSLTTAAAANKRFIIGGAHFSSAFAIDILRSLPEIMDRLPNGPPEEEARVIKLDVSELDSAFGIKNRTARETFHDTAKRLLELEKQFAH